MAVSGISIFNVVSYRETLFKSETLLIALQFLVMLQSPSFTFHVLLYIGSVTEAEGRCITRKNTTETNDKIEKTNVLVTEIISSTAVFNNRNVKASQKIGGGGGGVKWLLKDSPKKSNYNYRIYNKIELQFLH